MTPINKISMPKWQQSWNWIVNPVAYMSQAVKEYADFFTVDIIGFGDSLLFVNHPEAIQQILTNDRQTFFADGSLNTVLAPIVGYSSLLGLDGERHKREKKLLMPPFHGDRMISYGDSVQEIVDDLFSRFQVGDVFITREVMQEISLQVILKVVFGLTKGERFSEMAVLIKDILDRFNKPINVSFLFYEWLRQDWGKWSPWGKVVRRQKRLDELIYQEIEERRKESRSDRVDVLSLLLAAQDENGEGLTNQQLRDELMLILFAGHETTAIAMSWALYWIHYLPRVKEKLLAELDGLPTDIDGMTIYKQPYLTAVCNETLRIHPVAMLTFPRVATKDVDLLGTKVKKGTVLSGCIYLIHQREDLYPNPTEFKPERFLERQYSPYEFLPFGGGVRRCLGEALAAYEMRLVVAKILREFDLELVEKKPVKPTRRGVVLSPKGGIPMRFLGKR